MNRIWKHTARRRDGEHGVRGPVCPVRTWNGWIHHNTVCMLAYTVWGVQVTVCIRMGVFMSILAFSFSKRAPDVCMCVLVCACPCVAWKLSGHSSLPEQLSLKTIHLPPFHSQGWHSRCLYDLMFPSAGFRVCFPMCVCVCTRASYLNVSAFVYLPACVLLLQQWLSVKGCIKSGSH